MGATITTVKSKIYPGITHKVIWANNDSVEGRVDISNVTEPLQLAVLGYNAGKTFKPHKHIYHDKIVKITQEAWVVIKGKVLATCYDIDNKCLEKFFLHSGDCIITYEGGHNYEFLEDDTLIYEFKTGPYYGQEFDKEFID